MPSHAPRSRPPLLRMQRIHQELQAHRAPNCSSLAQALEVSTKTVRRDLEYMRDQLGLPIEYDPAQHAYFYNREVHAFPTLQVTEGEVLALFVAQKALAQYSGTPFEDPLRHAFEKIASSMGDVLTVSPDGLAEALSFRHTGDAVADMALFQAVTDAVLQSRELRFTYHKLNATRPEPRHVQPYHLACIDHGWYLFAHDLDRQAIRCFALTRLKTLLELGAPFEKPADFSLKEHLMSSFGVFTGEGDFTVRIAFDAFAARLVRERHWHSSQSLRELPDGSLELALRLASLEEIERWTLSWGSHAKVLAPAQLKQRVKRALDKMQASYAEPPAWFAEVREAASTLPQDQVLRLVVALDQPRHDPNQLHFRFRERSRLAAG